MLIVTIEKPYLLNIDTRNYLVQGIFKLLRNKLVFLEVQTKDQIICRDYYGMNMTGWADFTGLSRSKV